MQQDTVPPTVGEVPNVGEVLDLATLPPNRAAQQGKVGPSKVQVPAHFVMTMTKIEVITTSWTTKKEFVNAFTAKQLILPADI